MPTWPGVSPVCWAITVRMRSLIAWRFGSPVSTSVFASSVSRCCALRSSVMSMPEQIRYCSSAPLPLCTNLLRNWNSRGPFTVLM
ncbi:hypothetical protein FEP90_05660 [Burkholderia multivorans]|nr:hypothetical protein [Burkholderia multivorans]